MADLSSLLRGKILDVGNRPLGDHIDAGIDFHVVEEDRQYVSNLGRRWREESFVSQEVSGFANGLAGRGVDARYVGVRQSN